MQLVTLHPCIRIVFFECKNGDGYKLEMFSREFFFNQGQWRSWMLLEWSELLQLCVQIGTVSLVRGQLLEMFMVIQGLDNILVRGQLQEEMFKVIWGLDNIFVRGQIIEEMFIVIQDLDNILVRGRILKEMFIVIWGLDNISLVRGRILEEMFKVIQGLDNILVRGWILEEMFMIIQGLDNIHQINKQASKQSKQRGSISIKFTSLKLLTG